ncbi:MAG: nucleoside phosphorylase [Desulfosporosinus sp.]|jgi:uridine phosphorylase
MASILDNDRQFHLLIKSGDIGKYVFLCGDPGRVPKIAAYFENSEFLLQNREYTIYNGFLCGQKVTAVSTGIGGPSAAICVEELIKCGAHTFIRIGTSGGIRNDVIGGDLVIVTAAVRDDGTSREYLPNSYPAVADFDVVKALADEAELLCDKSFGNNFHIGIVQSKDSFYGETNPETMPISEILQERWESYIRLGCLASEMECAAIFSVAQTRGVRAGAVLLAIWNVERAQKNEKSPVTKDTNRAIGCAIGAMKRLIRGGTCL